MINLLEARPYIDGHTITAKAESLWQTDPHGIALTVIAVSTVFLGLLILYFIYSFSGNIFSGKYKNAIEEKKKKKAARKAVKAVPGKVNDEVATAIAMALQMNGGDEVYAAIATALHLHVSCNSHDGGPFVLTIKPCQSAWGNKMLNLRKKR
ncbi:MAG: OadG family protein [Bacteroidales bacterium]|nr:OadG family protein [Bacteroidales bacterium]